MSGDSAWDRWQNGDDDALSRQAKPGNAIFFGKAFCNQCHFGQNLTDNQFHNMGIGWDEQSGSFSDVGGLAVDRGPKSFPQ